MCGRYTLRTSYQVIADLFEVDNTVGIPLRYNIAPSQDVPVIRLDEGDRTIKLARWGLIPFWAKDPKISYKLINARSESISEKPAFRQAFKKRRCLVIADGFYEWVHEGSTKKPHYIYLKNEMPFAFAGLYEHWMDESSQQLIESCTILTTSANELVQRLHHRMPVILPKQAYTPWLDPQTETTHLEKWLVPYEGSQMQEHEVGILVNNPRNDDPRCILSVDAPPARLIMRKE